MLQKQLEEFQSRLSTFRESLGVIGDENASGSEIPNVSATREKLFEELTTAAITETVVLEFDSKTVELDRIARIEHQSWIRGFDLNGDLQVENLMDVNQISTTNGT